MKWLYIIPLLLLTTGTAHARLPVIDLNVFYFSDTMAYNSQTSTYGRTFYDFMLGLPLDSKGRWVVGWNYDAYSFTDNPGTVTKLTISDMGPKFVYAFDKDKVFTLGFSYNLITTGKYSAGGATSSDLRGTSMRAEFGYLPLISENAHFGLKLNYYKASFSEEITNQTSLAKVTDSRTAIYPSLALTYRFD